MVGSFTFPTGSQSTVGEQRSPVQITTRQDYLLEKINDLVGAGLYSFPDVASSGTGSKYLQSDGDGTTTWKYAIESSVALNNDQGDGSANQALITEGDATLNWSYLLRSDVDLENDDGAGSAGQVIQSDGDGTVSWLTITVNSAWAAKVANFTSANNGRYKCTGGIDIQLHAIGGATEEFFFMPQIGQDLEVSPINILQAGSESIGGSAATFIADVNGLYHLVTDGTDWDVAIYPLLRS